VTDELSDGHDVVNVWMIFVGVGWDYFLYWFNGLLFIAEGSPLPEVLDEIFERLFHFGLFSFALFIHLAAIINFITIKCLLNPNNHRLKFLKLDKFCDK
jgi:hypothetical protein